MDTRVIKGFALVGLVSLLTACGFKEGKMRGDFMQACVVGATEKVCKCTWDGLKDHYGIDRLLGLEDAGVLPSDLIGVKAKVMGNCIAGIPNTPGLDLLGSSAASPVQPVQGTPAQQANAEAAKVAEAEAAQGQAAADVLQGGNAESKTLALGSHILSIKRKGDVDPFVVSMDGKELKRVEAFDLDFAWSSGGDDRTGYALLGISSGGTACPMTYFIVEVSPDGTARVSPEFGSCSDQSISAQVMPWGVEVKMPGFQGPSESPANQAKAAAETQIYRWDEGRLISPQAASSGAAPQSSLKEQAEKLKIGDVGYQPKPGERVMYYAAMLKSQKKRMELCKKFKPLLNAEGLQFAVCLHADTMAG